MKKIAIMTDTNSGITPADAKEAGIFLLKMPFMIDGEDFFEYESISYQEFFERLCAGAEVSTSQPSPGDLIAKWEEILETYESLIYIPMSSGLSGTYQTAKMLANDFEGRVFVVDNKRISVTLRESVMDALYLSSQGLSVTQIAEEIENDGMNSSIYVAVNTLEYLKKSGRVTTAGATIGTLLGIKPVLQIQGGKLDAFKKVRGMQSAMEAMLDGIEDDAKNRFAGQNIQIRAAYSGHIDTGNQWRDAVAERFPDYEIKLDALPISISCHVGPGALGIGISGTKRTTIE